MTGSPGRSADKVALSRKSRGSRYRETPDVTHAVGRLIRAVGKRVATEDPEDLRYLLALDAELAVAWRTSIDGLRRSEFTDGQIGEALGITKQAVAQRWPRGENT